MNEVYIYGRKLSAEELQADSLKRLERLTTNTPMAPVDKTPARAEGCGVAMTIIGRDVFDEAERDALRQQLAETRKKREREVSQLQESNHRRAKSYNELAEEKDALQEQVTALTKAKAALEQQIATLTEVLETYGQHARDCKVGHARWIQEPRGNKPGVVAHDHPCTCGFSAALAAARVEM